MGSDEEPYIVGRGRPPRETQFKKGQKRHPLAGRPKTPPDILEARKVNQAEFERILNKYLYTSRAELKKIIETPGTPMIEVVVASILAQAALKGDQTRLEFVLSRLLGKVKERVEVSGLNGGPIDATITAMTLDQRRMQIEKLRQLRESVGDD